MDSLNNDELGVILSFVPPQDLILSGQLVSKNFHKTVTTQDMLWKKYCDEYFLDDLFNWENDLFTKSLPIDEESKYFTLFCEWSKSIPRIELVGRYPTLSNYNGGAEQERSIFSRFDTSKYSFRNLTQLVILLNVFSLTKYGNEFNTEYARLDEDEEGEEYEEDEDKEYEEESDGYPFDALVDKAKFIPYDFVPSIWGDSVTITLSDRNYDDFTMLRNENKKIITKSIPFGAFCLMILSPNQQQKISLIGNIVSQMTKNLTLKQIENSELGVTASTRAPNPVCYFNRMHKWFTEERRWTDDKECNPNETWLGSDRAGFVTEYVFYENAKLKKVTMQREYYYR